MSHSRSNYTVLLFSLYTIFCFTLCSSCKDDEGESVITCSEDISFSVGSEEFSFPLDEFAENEPGANFTLNEPSFNNGNSISRTLSLIGRSDEAVFLLHLELNVEDENTCLPLGIYRATTTDTAIGVVSINYDRQGGLYLHNNDNSDVFIEITHCDLENGTVSGNFGGTLFLSPSGIIPSTLSIRSGVFESVCFE